MAKRIQNNNEPYQQNYNNSGSTIIKLFLVIAIFSCGTANLSDKTIERIIQLLN